MTSILVNPLALETPVSASTVSMGSFLSLTEDGCPVVDYEGNETGAPQIALSCVPLSADNVGCEVAIGFLSEDRLRPIILGLIQRTVTSKAEPPSQPAAVALPPGVEVKISADQELILECGKASITLTHEGKIVLSGEYVVSRSYGVNQIQGASVQIN